MKGETVSHESILHWVWYLPPVTMCFVSLFLINDTVKPIVASALLLPLFWVFRLFCKYTITNERIMLRLGIITLRDAFLSEIQSVYFEGTENLDRFFGGGRINVILANQRHIIFKFVHQPREFISALNEAIASQNTSAQ